MALFRQSFTPMPLPGPTGPEHPFFDGPIFVALVYLCAGMAMLWVFGVARYATGSKRSRLAFAAIWILAWPLLCAWEVLRPPKS